MFAEPGQSIGISALVIVTMIGAGFVPCVGSIVQIIATGPLIAAWYLYFLKRMRGQPTEWGDVFAGFSSPDADAARPRAHRLDGRHASS